jgi:VWFA-related protein
VAGAWSCAVVAALLLAPSARAESPLDARSVERLQVDDVSWPADRRPVVELHVRALSHAGSPVTGLRPADVQVWQDEVQIESDRISVKSFTPAEPFAVVLALDVSKSMRGETLKRVKQGALAFLERLRTPDRSALVTFAEEARVVADFSVNRQKTKDALNALEIDPERSQRSFLYDGTRAAIELIRQDASLPRRAYVVLFSDGGDADSSTTLERAVKAARGVGDAPPIVLFALGYPALGSDLGELRALTAQSAGEFRQVDLDQIPRAFEDFAEQIESSYLIAFRGVMDGQSHSLRVAIEGQSATVEALYPYEPPPPWRLIAAAGGGVLALVLLAVLWLRRSRNVGSLRVLSGPRAGGLIALRGPRMTVGNADGNDVILDVRTVSRRHAEIVVRRGRVEIRDLHSTNGTRLNGVPIEIAPLQPGDKIEIGDVELVYEP